MRRLCLAGALLLIVLNFVYLGCIGWHAAWWDFYFTRAEGKLSRGQVKEAEQDYLQAVKYAELMVPSDGRLARTYHDLGMVYWAQLRYDQARRIFERSQRGFERYDGPQSYFVGVVLARQGEVSLQQGDMKAAESALRQASVILARCVGREDSMSVRCHASLGLALYYLGRRDEARQYLRPIGNLVAGNPRVGDIVYQNQVRFALEALRQVP